jgi:hypothetical protein
MKMLAINLNVRLNMSIWLFISSLVAASAMTCPALTAQTFTYREPFGVAHRNVILKFDLPKQLEAGAFRLVSDKGMEDTFQIARNGKKLLLRTDLAANETRRWQLVLGKPRVRKSSTVVIAEEPSKRCYEISNGLTGVRIPSKQGFVDETAGLDAKTIATAEQSEWSLEQIKKGHHIDSHTAAPLQGLRLRDGSWTALGPNSLRAKALASTMKVEFLERGPLETTVKLSYGFKAKPPIPRDQKYPDRSPGYPGGDGHYCCTIKVLADEPSILFEEDADVETSWRLNLLPELRFDTARHPQRQPDGKVKDVDWTIPFDGDYVSSYVTQDKCIIHLMPWGWYGGEYYWMLFNSQGDSTSPVVGVFADKSQETFDADASGPGLISSDNWLGSGGKGGGFNVQVGRRMPDARTFPFVHIRWGLFVGVKGTDLAPLGKSQPIVRQMDLHGGLTPQLRHVSTGIPELPRLDWEERSDWINVKTKVRPRAVGDGVVNDTAALQAALDVLKDGYDVPNTVYLPPGRYRITQTLRWGKLHGKRIIGHGRETRIVWDGDGGSPPVMFHSDGVTSDVLFEGIAWDGTGKAEVGIDHCSNNLYESHITHRHEAFYNLGTGIVTSYSDYFHYQQATAEVLFDNCLFVNCGQGVAFGSYNALNNTVSDCGFYCCGRGVANNVGNVYVRCCHFEGSLDADIYTHVGDNSALRCTSVGSKRFLHGGGNLFVMEDCHVDGWTSSRGAVQRQVTAPLTMFDCSFSNPPDHKPPIQSCGGAAVLTCNCRSQGTDSLLDTENAITIPPGRRGSVVSSAQQGFFRSDVQVPRKVFDARRDFGAKGDGKSDDTRAVWATIKAAREHGNQAIAYLPHGQYRVTQTIGISGANYVIGGAGSGWQCGTRVLWGGQPPVAGKEVAVFHVGFATNVTIADLNVTTPSDYYEDKGVISILHTGANLPTFVTYDDVGGFFQFRGLSPSDRVNIKTINGVLDFDNCQRGTVLAEQFCPTRHPQSRRFDTTLRVRGNDRTLAKDGLLGMMTFFNAGNPYDISVEDSQSLVISDYYTEQTERVLRLKGNPADSPGHFTLLVHKFHGEHYADMVHVRNYKGAIYLGASFLPQPPLTGSEKGKNLASSMAGVKLADQPLLFSHQGANPVNILLVGCDYLTGAPSLQKESGATYILANDFLNGRPWHTKLSDDEKLKISESLDELRRLGEADMEFKGLLTRREK